MQHFKNRVWSKEERMTKELKKVPERQIRSTTQQKNREINLKKSPRRREVCATDRILAEVKVSSSAPGGPPRHSSLPLSSSNKKALSPLLRTHALALTDRLSSQGRASRCSTAGFGSRQPPDLGCRRSQSLAVALFISPSVPFPSILKQSRLGCALIVSIIIIIILVLLSSRPSLGYLWWPK